MIFLILFMFGCILGSFGSVLLIRTEDGLSSRILHGMMVGRSACPHCYHTLRWRQLIPLIGWMIQKGQCYDCYRPIAYIYLLLELVAGLQVVGIYILYTQGLFVGGGYAMLTYIVVWLFGLLAVWDIKTMTLHMIGWYMACLANVGLVLRGIYHSMWFVVSAQMQYAICFYIFFVGIRYIGKKYAMRRYGMPEGLGWGDVLVSPIVGLVIGTVFPQTHVLSAVLICWIYIIITALIGLVIGGISYIYTHKIIIPFLPCMIIALWLLLVYYHSIVSLFVL